MLLQYNVFEIPLSDEIVDFLFVIIIVALTILLAKIFQIKHMEVIMILFVFNVTYLYSLDLCSLTLLITSYFVLGIWLFIMINKVKNEEKEV